MKLTLHIVRKDLTRLRWPLAAWLATVIANLGIGFALIAGMGLEHHSRDLEFLTMTLRVAGYLLTFVLTGMLVQGDALVGSTQFWLTRPISGGRLLAAKLSGWFLLLCLPQVVVTLPWWIACGFDARQIGLATLEVLAWQVAVALPAALMAAITDTFGRFVLWSTVAVPLLVVGAPGVGASFAVAQLTGIEPLAGSVQAVYVLVLAGVVVAQFFLRDAKRASLLLFLGMLLSPGLAALGSWSLGRIWAERSDGWTDWRAERVAEVKVAVAGAWTQTLPRVSGSGNQLSMMIEVRGLPRELVITPGDALATRQTWRWPDGTTLSRDAQDGVGVWPGNQTAVRTALDLGAEPPPDEETRRYQRKMWEQRAKKSLAWAGLPRPMIGGEASAGARVRVDVHSEVSPATIERMRRTPPAYEVTLPLRAIRVEKWLETPLLAGGWQASHGYGFRLGAVGGGEKPQTPVVLTRPRYIWDLFGKLGKPGFSTRGAEAEMLLLHRRTGAVSGRGLSGGPTLTIASVEIARRYWSMPVPRVRRGEKWVAVPHDENWYAEATVALVGYREEARFTREVKVEKVDIQP